MDFSDVGKEKKTNVTKLPTPIAYDMTQVKVDFGKFHQAIDDMEMFAKNHVVDSEETLKESISMAGQTRTLFKQIETQRKATVEDPNRFVKSVNGFVKDFTSKLNRIEAMLKKNIADYRYRQELERREAERKAQEEAKKLQEKLDKEAEEKGVEPVKVVTPMIPKEDKVARSDTGASASFRKQWVGEIEDPDAVPRAMCEPSMKKINEAIKAGIRSIKGVKIYEKTTTILRT